MFFVYVIGTHGILPLEQNINLVSPQLLSNNLGTNLDSWINHVGQTRQ